MCCLNSLAAVMQHLDKEKVTAHILPIFVKACKDEIPNVKFCVTKIIINKKQYIDANQFNSVLLPLLKEMANDTDKDVVYFALHAINNSV